MQKSCNFQWKALHRFQGGRGNYRYKHYHGFTRLCQNSKPLQNAQNLIFDILRRPAVVEWSVFLQDQINSVLSLRTKAEKCLCSGWAVWLLYISIKIFQAKVFVVIEDSYLRNCNWAYLFSGPAAACVFPAKSEQVTPPAYCGLNIWPQSNTQFSNYNYYNQTHSEGRLPMRSENWNFQQKNLR